MHVFGLTGGIASGKSSVAKVWRSLGLPIIDADILAREVVAKRTPGLEEIRAAFGDGVINAEGELDRKAMGAIVFADEKKRKQLNAITHPRIWALTAARAKELGDAGEPLACYEAALLVENGMADAFRPLVVVSAPAHVQIERARARDAASENEAKARVFAQMPLAEKVALADLVIENNGSFWELEGRAREALRAVCTRCAIETSRYGL